MKTEERDGWLLLLIKLIAVCMWSTLNVVSFNPQVAHSARRLETLLRYWKQEAQDIVVLTGTKRRAGEEACEIDVIEGYQCFHFGHANRNDAHAGITIAIALKLLKAGKVSQVWNPDRRLAGRLAAVRIKSACSDVLIVGMYPPPWSSPRNRSKFELTIKHADKLISEQAHRVCPIICADANARVGLRPAEDGGGWCQDEAEQIGHWFDEYENQPGKLFRTLAVKQAISLVTTLWPNGPTYFHPKTSGTRIDYIGVPTAMMRGGRVKWAGVRYHDTPHVQNKVSLVPRDERSGCEALCKA
eukprot:TRINITY_DN21867_c0_g2_i1.p1 TRINITY_DN21867_c0_g2~~TRINITY_DN21867_c0_g2_i1.p1  ORF type:complete len:300 (-),score=49.29 TRINITY_DN21867_c0_g2_i1:196-1095(-)